jgi:hypothetical protein
MSTTTEPKAIPAVLSGHALRSLRDSGYDLSAALGEVIDNAIEANANRVDVWFTEQDAVGKGRKAHISEIVVVDDGDGMGTDDQDRDVLQHYLQLGYSTRYMSTTTIGKFGVGAKLGALSFARRIDVWSRIEDAAPWRHVHFDLDEALATESQSEFVTIGEPNDEAVPEELEFLLPGEGSGTLVRWSKVDRLEEGRWASSADNLRLDVSKELSRIFRYFLAGGIEICVQEKRLLAYDPLMLMEGTWQDEVLAKEEKRKAVEEAKAETKDGEDPPRARKVPSHFEAKVIGRRKLSIAGHDAEMKVTLYPPEVTRHRQAGGDKLAKALRVRENQGKISFVRLNREINYTTVAYAFPSAVSDSDRHIGIEVSFNPELDEYFGVRNVKKGVEPHGELREQMRDRLAGLINEARTERDRRWDEQQRERQEHHGEHVSVVEAVNETNRKLPKSRARADGGAEAHQEALKELAHDVGKATEEEQDEYIERTREQAIVIESVELSGSGFLDVQHINGQVIVRINIRHRFYKELYAPIKTISEQDPGTVSGVEAVQTARRTREALTVMIAAYAKAESMDENPRDAYGTLRDFWGMFLSQMMGDVRNVL